VSELINPFGEGPRNLSLKASSSHPQDSVGQSGGVTCRLRKFSRRLLTRHQLIYRFIDSFMRNVSERKSGDPPQGVILSADYFTGLRFQDATPEETWHTESKEDWAKPLTLPTTME
jgi:hypothetical protein